VTAVEDASDPYSELQAAHWDKLHLDRRKAWGQRSPKSQVLDWLINDVRLRDAFHNADKILSYDRFRATHLNDAFALSFNTWCVAGELLGVNRQPRSAAAIMAEAADAKTGYDAFCSFHLGFHVWRAAHRARGEDVYRAANVLRSLGCDDYEKRLVRLRYAEWGSPGYRQAAMVDGNQLKHGQVPTLAGLKQAHAKIADTLRKRKVTGAVARKVATPHMTQAQAFLKKRLRKNFN
jgi:hypothetical protein